MTDRLVKKGWIGFAIVMLTACSGPVHASCGQTEYEAISSTDITVPISFELESNEIGLIQRIVRCYKENPLRKSDDVLIFSGIKREFGKGGLIHVELAGYSDVSFIVRYSESGELIWFKQLIE